MALFSPWLVIPGALSCTMRRDGWIYILTNVHKTVLYVGVTSELKQRVLKHKTKFYKDSFTSKYNCDRLVYYEHFNSIVDAIDRETQLKRCDRKTKVDLINKFNPEWKDLFDSLSY